MTRNDVLIQMMQSTRGLTKYFLKRFKDKELDWYYRPSADGYSFNCAFWILAHTAWAQHYLLLEQKEGKYKEDWLYDFTFGSSGDTSDAWPKLEVAMEAFNSIHERALERVQALSAEELESPFHDDNFKRQVDAIYHWSRHEAMHIGNLSWLMKAMDESSNR